MTGRKYKITIKKIARQKYNLQLSQQQQQQTPTTTTTTTATQAIKTSEETEANTSYQ
jgi:hypothetical protein